MEEIKKIKSWFLEKVNNINIQAVLIRVKTR